MSKWLAPATVSSAPRTVSSQRDEARMISFVFFQSTATTKCRSLRATSSRWRGISRLQGERGLKPGPSPPIDVRFRRHASAPPFTSILRACRAGKEMPHSLPSIRELSEFREAAVEVPSMATTDRNPSDGCASSENRRFGPTDGVLRTSSTRNSPSLRTPSRVIAERCGLR